MDSNDISNDISNDSNSDSSDSSSDSGNDKNINFSMNKDNFDYLSNFDKKTFDKFKDKKRVKFLKKTKLLHTLPEYRFDKITQVVKTHFNVPVVLISLVDKKQQWFKSCIGLNITGSNRKDSFCSLTIKKDEIFIVHNASEDERVNKSCFVTGNPFINFYVGFPVHNKGQRIGTLCIIDFIDRSFSKSDELDFITFASMVDNEIQNINYIRSLNHENDMKNRMISIMTNMISNNLGSVNSFFPIVIQNDPNNATLKMLHKKIAVSKLHADNILDVYAHNINKICINKEYLNIQDILLNINMFDINIKYSVEYGDKLYCDKDKIVRTLCNLVNDSLLYLPENNKKINIMVVKCDKFIKFILCDNGNRKNKITDDYFGFSKENDINKKLDDEGIGLFCSKLIIKAHSGEIWHEHKINEGIYIFTIPIAQTLNNLERNVLELY